MSDRCLDVVYQHWRHFVRLYEMFADKRPVLLYDMQDGLIYAMPYEEYRAGLSKRSQASLKRQRARDCER